MKILLHYTLQNEIQYVEKITANLNWFIKNGYKIKLPKEIDKNSKSAEINKAVIKEFSTANEVFNGVKPRLKRYIEKNQNIIDEFFSYFSYDIPQEVNVYFTIYGPGGSYSPPNKIIVMLKDSVEWILQMIIHETIHIIIEKPFIRKYNISHWEKEAVVDSLCKSSVLKNICSNYKLQKQAKRLPVGFLENLDFKEKSSLIQE